MVTILKFQDRAGHGSIRSPIMARNQNRSLQGFRLLEDAITILDFTTTVFS